MNTLAFIVALFSGLAFVIGYIIKKLTNRNLNEFSIGLSFSVLLFLIFKDLIPECIELFDKWYICLIFVFLGSGVLKLIDLCLPNHTHSKNDNHLVHIGLMSFIALIIHNLIESTAIYVNASNEINTGLFMAIAVFCHNVPLGIQISSLVESNKKSLSFIITLFLSSIVGPLLMIIFGIVISDVLLSILIAITLGMLIYIVVFELLHEVIEHIKKKEMLFGLFIGILLSIIIGII